MFLKNNQKYNLINKNDKILVAFSGGADSVFLLERLLEIKEEYNLKLHLAYVNHNLRDDVLNDIKIVKRISKKYALDLSILDIKLDDFSENEARNLRYEALENLRYKLNFDKIATGHNKSDNAETIIFNIIRGTGISGIKGIPPKRGNIIRPILYITKKEILKYVLNEYVVDKTNFENKYSRNKIRNQIFPLFNEINEGYIDNIIKLSQNVLENDDFKINLIKELKEKNIEINYNKINEICSLKNKNGTKIVSLGNEYYWYKSYYGYKILKKENIFFEEKEKILYLNNEIEFNGYIIGFTNRLEKKLENYYNILELNNLNDISNVLVRTRKNGDRLSNKKIKELFINEKIDKIIRDRMPIILLNNEIVMVGDKFKNNKFNSKTGQYKIYVGRKDEKK